MLFRCVCFCLSILFLSSDVLANRNVVLMISDNQNRDDCGCYGNPVIKTPRIDALAREGVRFADAFATTASCGPSRAVIYSGLQTHSNGQYGHGHGIHTYRLSPHVQTVFRLLGDNGYETALLGKRHTTPDEAYPFTFEKNVSGRDITGITRLAREFIEQSGDKPFFLAIGYSDPHPTSRQRPGWSVLERFQVTDLVGYSPGDVIVPRYLHDQPEVREGLTGYYEQITQMDHGVGQVLDVIRESGKEDETLVIFTSDHGSSEPGAMGNHYEPGIQVPFVVRCPGIGAAGSTNKALVTLADITPTVLDWTGTKTPAHGLHGKSILPVLDDPDGGGFDEVVLTHVCHEVTMYYPMRTIRNRRYKLIWNVNWRSEYPLPIDTLQRATWQESLRRGDGKIGKRTIDRFLFRDQIELYDLENDPDELKNLADDEKHHDVRRKLTEKMLSWLRETNDPWLERHRPTMPGEPISRSTMQTVPSADD